MKRTRDISSLGVSEMFRVAINHNLAFHMILVFLKLHMYGSARRILGIH